MEENYAVIASKKGTIFYYDFNNGGNVFEVKRRKESGTIQKIGIDRKKFGYLSDRIDYDGFDVTKGILIEPTERKIIFDDSLLPSLLINKKELERRIKEVI